MRALPSEAVPVPTRRHRLVGGPLSAVMGAVGSREVEGVRRLAREEEPVLEGLSQPSPRL